MTPTAAPDPAPPPTASFRFRPWVRRSCKKAMAWGMGVVALLAAVVWALQGPQGWAWDRAFGSLLGYSLLFWLTLAKIWWTAGKPAVEVTTEALAYQGLHAFRPKRVPYERILACGPKAGTQSLRLVVEKRGAAKELFLNLGIVAGRHRLIDVLGRHLVAAGLAPLPGSDDAWAHPEWREPSAGL